MLNSQIKLSIALSILVITGAVFYINLDTAAKACFILTERFLKREAAEPAGTVGQLTRARYVGPPDQNTEAKNYSVGQNRRKIVVTRGGETYEYWVQGAIFQAYNEIGEVKSILGVPTSNEYRWKKGLRQDFERGHWLFWSKSTGVLVDYNPPGFDPGSLHSLQPPVFSQGKPAVEWNTLSKTKYFLTQNFGENGHLGQDLGFWGNPNPGFEVHPITDGKVVFSGWTGSNSYGYSVLIRHELGNGRKLYSQYSHLYSNPSVFPGQLVSKDTILGLIGDTGKSSGPHLDLQIKEIPRLDNKKDLKVDPSDLGYGYTAGHIDFEGNIFYDIRTGQTYYKPSYLIENYRNDPSSLINEFHRVMDLNRTMWSNPLLTSQN